jgi:hypothetical protein
MAVSLEGIGIQIFPQHFQDRIPPREPDMETGKFWIL